MTLLVDYQPESRLAILRMQEGLAPLAWTELQLLLRPPVLEAAISGHVITLPWPAFVGQLRGLAHLQRKHSFRASYTTTADQLVRKHVAEARAVEELRRAQPALALAPAQLESRLVDRGWDLAKRRLTAEQQRDVLRLLNMPNGADFSVPGSGKTTVLLAVHLVSQEPDVALLVVAPKNAFPAWDQMLRETLVNPLPEFVRLVGGRRRIEGLLQERPARLLITYSQLVRVVDLVADQMSRRPVHLVLDESHKIKAGRAVQSGVAAATIAPLAVRRDILSGTPMPNAIEDLAPQFEFLFPGHGIGSQITSAASARTAVGPFYVRTTKGELGLPEPVTEFVPIDMSDPQRVLYGLARDQVLRQLKGLRTRQLSSLSRSSVMRLLQVAIDPQAAVAAMMNSDPTMAQIPAFRTIADQLFTEEVSPRVSAAIELATSLAGIGRKVVLWVPFTRTIQTLTAALSDLGAEAIYGEVPSGDESDEDTRESILLRFHNDAQRQVLVANPAAGGEGISLHRVCHDAIFVGRTYNAAHYLQARDRIHRLGLSPGALTRITLLESRAPGGLGSIDMSVRRRLNWKVDQMARALDDPDLTQLALESDEADPTLDDGLTFEDLVDLVHELTDGKPV